MRRLHGPYILLLGLANDIRQMLRLLAGDVQEIRSQSRLDYAHPEAIRKSSSCPAMQRASSVFPTLGQGLAIAAVDIDIRAVGPIRYELEAGSVDDAVDFIFVVV